jgi:hypothetical protein
VDQAAWSAYQINEWLYESGIRTRHGKERWGIGEGQLVETCD